MWNFDRISTNLSSWYVTNIKSYLINVWLKMFHWIIHIFQSLIVLCRVLCKNIWKFSCFLFELIWCFTSTLVGEHKLWNSWSLGTRIFVKYWRKSNNLSSLVLNFRIEIKHMLREIVMVLSKKNVWPWIEGCQRCDERLNLVSCWQKQDCLKLALFWNELYICSEENLHIIFDKIKTEYIKPHHFKD